MASQEMIIDPKVDLPCQNHQKRTNWWPQAETEAEFHEAWRKKESENMNVWRTELSKMYPEMKSQRLDEYVIHTRKKENNKGCYLGERRFPETEEEKSFICKLFPECQLGGIPKIITIRPKRPHEVAPVLYGAMGKDSILMLDNTCPYETCYVLLAWTVLNGDQLDPLRPQHLYFFRRKPPLSTNAPVTFWTKNQL